jgi:LuxR family maltose regulon positive regulatory protein
MALRTMEAIMLALRSRGRFRQAKVYTDAIVTIFAVGREHQPAQIVPVAPSVLLQSGITRLVGDDLAGALLDLRVAYDRAREGPASYVDRDAAGKTALIHALTGDVISAQSWLRRYDATAEPSGWLAGTIAQSVTLASAIIAIEQLDRDRASAQIARVLAASGPASHESLLSPYAVYVQARYALIWGDRHDALLRIEHERTHAADWVHEGATVHALLYAIEADLLMALGLGNRAQDLLERAPQHPSLASARARFALMAETHDSALDATSSGLDGAVSMTVRAELLLIRAIAQREAGNDEAATESLGYAVKVAQTAGSVYAFATVGNRLAVLAERNPTSRKMIEAARASGAWSFFPERLAIVELTEREKFILDRIVIGMNMREMANDLFVSYNTVKTQMRRLYQKLGARSREQALVRAHVQGLLPLP